MKQSDVIELIHPGLQKKIQDKGWTKGLKNIQLEAIPIRSLAYTFWSEFNLRNKLKESNLFPESDEK